jgi:ferrous iron transport protein A
MSQNEQLTVAQMRTGQTGTVVGVMGGPGLIRRLDALGIRSGRKITKVSSALFRGPVMLRVNSAQVAVGYGMARKIVIEVDKHVP